MSPPRKNNRASSYARAEMREESEESGRGLDTRTGWAGLVEAGATRPQFTRLNDQYAGASLGGAGMIMAELKVSFPRPSSSIASVV